MTWPRFMDKPDRSNVIHLPSRVTLDDRVAAIEAAQEAVVKAHLAMDAADAHLIEMQRALMDELNALDLGIKVEIET